MNRAQYEYHPTIGYKFIAGLKSRVQHEGGGYFVKTNNYGFRSDQDYIPEKGTKKRILVFGDSFTAGDGVSNKFRYTDLLQESLTDTEVYNFGLPGSGTDQQYLLYKEYAPQFDHDLLIISVLVENIRRVNAHFRYYLDAGKEVKVWQKPYFELNNGELILHNTPVNPSPIRLNELNEEEKSRVDTGGKFETLRKLVKRFGLKELLQKIVRFQPVPDFNRASNPEWLLMKAILEKWILESKVPVLLMPIPLFHHVEGVASAKAYQKRFAELSSRCTIHDPLPDLLKYDAGERRAFRFEKDVHLTSTGHKAIADSLLPALQKIV